MDSKKSRKAWRRMIAMVDTGDFLAAVELLDNPRLQGRPFGVVSGEQGALLLAASPETRAFGIRPGDRWDEARQRCPELARVVARPARYAELSGRLMQALAEVSPDAEAFAMGEAFVDLTRCQAYYRHDTARIATLLREAVLKSTGLACTVGLAADKTTARWAARQCGPAGARVVPPDEAEAVLAPLPLAELCAIAPAIAEFFAAYGVERCGDMKRIPIHVPARRFGNLGRRLWLMAQGRDPAPVEIRQEPALLSCGRLLPPGTCGAETLHAHFAQLAEKLSQRLRRDGQRLQDFRIDLRAPEGWRQDWLQTAQPTDDAREILRLCKRFLRQQWFGEPVPQIRLHGGRPSPSAQQPDFFQPSARRPVRQPRPRSRAGTCGSQKEQALVAAGE